MELRSGWKSVLPRLVIGFVVALLLYRMGIETYTQFLAKGLDATLGVASPPELSLNAVERDGTILKLYYLPRELAAAAPAGQIMLDQWFEFNVAAVGTWDFIVVVTLFAGLSLGCPGVAAARLVVLMLLLIALDFATIFLLYRTAYDPELNIYATESLVLFGPWIQQVVPLALWFVVCPHRLWDRMRASPARATSDGTA